MPDDEEVVEESVAQRIAREARERDEAAKATDLTGQPRDEQRETSERQISGAGSQEPLGRVVKREEHPGELKTDGSKSPHDVTSEGGSRQAAAHKQIEAAQQQAAEAEALRRGAGPASARNLAPTPEQAESGRVAREEGRAE